MLALGKEGTLREIEDHGRGPSGSDKESTAVVHGGLGILSVAADKLFEVRHEFAVSCRASTHVDHVCVPDDALRSQREQVQKHTARLPPVRLPLHVLLKRELGEESIGLDGAKALVRNNVAVVVDPDPRIVLPRRGVQLGRAGEHVERKPLAQDLATHRIAVDRPARL